MSQYVKAKVSVPTTVCSSRFALSYAGYVWTWNIVVIQHGYHITDCIIGKDQAFCRDAVREGIICSQTVKIPFFDQSVSAIVYICHDLSTTVFLELLKIGVRSGHWTFSSLSHSIPLILFWSFSCVLSAEPFSTQPTY